MTTDSSVRTEAESKRRHGIIEKYESAINEFQKQEHELTAQRDLELFRRVEIKGRESAAAMLQERNAVLQEVAPEAWAQAILNFPPLANQCTEEDALVLRNVTSVTTKASMSGDDMVLRVTLVLSSARPSSVNESELWIERKVSSTTGNVSISTSGATHSARPVQDAGGKKRKRKSEFGLINVFKQGHDEDTALMLLQILESIEGRILAAIRDEDDDDEEGEEIEEGNDDAEE
eukprot:TRINITY_DN74116_c0_g1_i1.p1 TRINITY_DN74116_c0_g1~~TRINITY_DN74116_c0_g1_i1.p1  ORF type:complete len:252 (+),score=109.32 TRINITY_DN74116_c0_g1_i1:59-757(+)